MISSLAGLVLRRTDACDYHGGLSSYELGHAMGGGNWYLVWKHTESGYQEPARPVLNEGELDALFARMSVLESAIAHSKITVDDLHLHLDLLRKRLAEHTLSSFVPVPPSSPPPCPSPSPAKECDSNVTNSNPCRFKHGEEECLRC